MTWQEFSKQLLPLGEPPTRERWQAAVDHAVSLLPQVDETDRGIAERPLRSEARLGPDAQHPLPPSTV
jgi:hypothetical protein